MFSVTLVSIFVLVILLLWGLLGLISYVIAWNMGLLEKALEDAILPLPRIEAYYKALVACLRLGPLALWGLRQDLKELKDKQQEE